MLVVLHVYASVWYIRVLQQWMNINSVYNLVPAFRPLVCIAS